MYALSSYGKILATNTFNNGPTLNFRLELTTVAAII